MKLLNLKIKDLPGNFIQIIIDNPNLNYTKSKDRAKLKKKRNNSVHFHKNPW